MRFNFAFNAMLFYCVLSIGAEAQTIAYGTSLRHSFSYTQDKNFYFITVLSKNKDANKVLRLNGALSNYLNQQKSQINKMMDNTDQTPSSLLSAFEWLSDTTQLMSALAEVYENSKKVFDNMVETELRPSGCYYRFNKLSSRDFFLNCWRETFKGINTIIDHYGLGAGFRYPNIDSASYDVNGEYYSYYLNDYFSFLSEHTAEMKTFYEPSLTIALDLMNVNERNEAAQYEPLEKGKNKKALEQIKKTNFENYKFSAILVPGQGPELEGLALDPVGRLRCELAAARFKQRLAPFIIVSGGNVHPFHTKFTEAMEMKKYLMKTDSIPESAIIIEPQARHTTTNFRNAGRLMIRYGIPMHKMALCISTKDQIDYIMDDRFDKRNISELGYIPLRNKQSLSPHEIAFFTVDECLQTDPIDPLDP